MAVIKRVLCPQRLRQVPSQFSWIDHRLVRDRHICRCSHSALALYLFLVTVCDGEGLSYYSDATLCRLLRLDPPALARARQELITARLIAYQSPLYQVLALDGQSTRSADTHLPSTTSPPPSPCPVQAFRAAEPSRAAEPPRRPGPPLSFSEILHRIMEHAQ
jgi:hypothetical protein